MAALDKATLVGGLGGLGKSPVHLKHAYLSLKLPDKGIGSIDIIRNYPHLQVVEMPGNSIKDISALSALAHVRRVNFRGNNLTEVLNFQPEPFEDNFAEHEFRVIVGSALEDADLSDNKIEEIEDLSHHRFLRTLNLANNNLSHLQGLDSLKHLQHLDLRNNDIYRIAGLDGLPLKSLNLSGNHISDLENLYTLVQLQVLEVADNELVSLSGLQNCKALNVLEASNNLVTNIHEVHHLVDLPLLSRLNLEGNEVTSTVHYRLRVLVYTQNRLEFLDGLQTSPEEKVKGANLFGADVEHRKSVHERHIEEEPFVNHMPPFEEEEEKRRETLQKSKAFMEFVAQKAMDSLIQQAAATATRRASELVDGIIRDTISNLAAGRVDVDRLSHA